MRENERGERFFLLDKASDGMGRFFDNCAFAIVTGFPVSRISMCHAYVGDRAKSFKR